MSKDNDNDIGVNENNKQDDYKLRQRHIIKLGVNIIILIFIARLFIHGLLKFLANV